MRIALATVGTTGDVRPFAVLARALLDAGHDVTVVTWPVHVAALAAQGLRAEAAGPHDDPSRIARVAEEAAARGPMAQVEVLRDFHLEDGVAHYRRLRDLLPAFDAVVLHGIHALAHAAALDGGVPFATAVFDPVLLPTRAAPPPGMSSVGPANRLLWALLDRSLARTGRPLDAILEAAGSGRRGLPLFRAHSPRLHLVACSPSIIAVPPDLPPTTHVVGAWLDRTVPAPLPDDVRRFVDAGAPPVVITFGSMGAALGSALRVAVEALVTAGLRVVIDGDPGLVHADVLSIGALDHRALFPRAAIVVHHGGAGTTQTAVAAGVGSVVVPHVGDQRYWADRLRRLGAAPPPVPADGLDGTHLATTTLAAVRQPSFGLAARALAARLAMEDGPGTAVGLLEGAFARGA